MRSVRCWDVMRPTNTNIAWLTTPCRLCVMQLTPGTNCPGLISSTVEPEQLLHEYNSGLYWQQSVSSYRRSDRKLKVGLLFVGCLTSQQQASVSQGRICCHTEIEVADQTFYLTQSQYTDTGPTSPSDDPITPGAWKGSRWSVNFEVTGMTRPRKNPGAIGIRTRDLPLSRRTP